MLQHGDGIHRRIARVGKHHEIRLIFELIVNRFKVIVHARANGFAGRKKEIYGVDLSFNILIGEFFAFLVGESKWFNFADGRETLAEKTGDGEAQSTEEQQDQNSIKNNVIN